MGYPENTAVSNVGQMILNDIFDLIYLQSDAPKNQIARMINNRSQIKEVVDNFKTNAPRIVTLMKRFMKGNTHVPRDDAGDSGIFVCNPLWTGFGGNTPAPDQSELGCGRRDHLWWWEWLDFGVYSSYSEWGGSIGLNAWPHNYVDQTWDDGQMVVARVRCNTVNTCDGQSAGCGTTWRGGGRCPNPNCEAPAAAKKTVGCGKTSYAMFHIKIDKPVSSYWHFSSGNYRNGAPIAGASAELPRKTLSIMKGNNAADDSNSVNAFYRFYWQGLPSENQFLSTFDQCMSHIPYLQVGYRSNLDPSKTRPGGYVCNSCGKERLAPPYDENSRGQNVWNTNFDIYPRKTTFTTANYPGDQHGGLCRNIGDVAGSYAGLSGTFGCVCGGTYEPRFKVPPIDAEDWEVFSAMNAAKMSETENQTTSSYVRTGRASAGSAASSTASIYGRGAKDTSLSDAVKRRYGGGRVLEANIAVNKVRQQQIMRAGNAYPFTVPVSKMRYAFTNTPLKICTAPTHAGVDWTNPSTGQVEKGSMFQPLLNERTGAAMDYCPRCGINGDAKYITTHPEKWLNPARPYTITSSQPLTDENTIGIIGQAPDGTVLVQKQTFLEKPQWTLVMRDLTDDQERYNLRLELPQAYLGDVIPTKFTPQPPPPTGDQDPEGFTCPNERQGPLAYEIKWLMDNIEGDPTLTPSLDNLQDDELLVEARVRAGDETLTVSPVIRVNEGDFISGGPYSNGTRIVSIDGSTLTVSPPANEIRGTGFNPDGTPVMISEFEAPFTIKFVTNTNADNPLSPDCCNGVQQPQYTFLVTEGKSASAFYSRVERDWVDTSPLVNYGDRKGLRWTEVNADAAEEATAIHTENDAIGRMFPSRIDPTYLQALIDAGEIENDTYQLPNPVAYGVEYQWCDLESGQQNQMVQDMFANANRNLRSVLENVGGGGSNWEISGSHRHYLAEETEAASSGIVQKYFKCRTCERLASIGLAASQRGMASSLVEALQNNTYYPGYATIRHYQARGDLDRDDNIIQPDGTIDLLPLPAGSLTKGYLEGAFDWETTPRDGQAAGWYNWAIRFLQELAEGGDYRLG